MTTVVCTKNHEKGQEKAPTIFSNTVVCVLTFSKYSMTLILVLKRTFSS